MWGWHHFWNWAFGGFFGLFWILIIVGFILFIKWLAQQGKPRETRTGGEEALEILKKRYARGEINKEEFDQKKKDLTS